MTNAPYVQYGSGKMAPEGWQNFDSSPRLRIQRIPWLGGWLIRNELRFPGNVRYGDIVKGLPVRDGSSAGVYCSHVLEHLSLNDCRTALAHTYQILQPGGIFRFVLPDLEFLVNRYLNDPGEEAALSLMKALQLGREQRVRTAKEFLVAWLGNSHHLWMWDYKSLKQELENSGFSGVRRAIQGDSPDPSFREVEEKRRWENCLGIECVRPEPEVLKD